MKVTETCTCGASLQAESEWVADVRTALNEFRELHDCPHVDMERPLPGVTWPNIPRDWVPWRDTRPAPNFITFTTNKVDLDKLDDEPDPVLHLINQAFH